jgi:hypothetical protein
VPSSPLLTSDDLDEIGAASLEVADPLAVAAELVEAVDQERLAHRSDIGYALMLAAEITERAEDLDGALVVAEHVRA